VNLERWVIQFHNVWAQDLKLSWEDVWSKVRISESTLNQAVELNYQFDDQDPIHAQVQFQEMDNLPKCQYDSQNYDVGQIQMGVMKLNLGFKNNMIHGLDR